MSSIVYILTNEAMPGLVKIGLTTDTVESRINNLNSATGVPLPFECRFAAEVEDCQRIEKLLHKLFSEHRVNPKREFFKLDPEKVVTAISIGNFTEVTPGKVTLDPQEEAALEKAKARKSRIRLEAIGIKTGDILTFSRDETITCTVIANNKVEFDGQPASLSASAYSILNKINGYTGQVNGSEFWCFDGETLNERRNRIEDGQFSDDATEP